MSATARLTSSRTTDPIEIYRDQFGVPHIFASNSEDAFFGQGLAHAIDRPRQMLSDWNIVFRQPANSNLECNLGLGIDFPWWRLDLRRIVRHEFKSLAPNTRRALKSYADGVNLGLRYSPHLDRSDPDALAWKPWDSLAIFKLKHLDMGSFARKLARTNLVACGQKAAVEYLYSVKDLTPILDAYGVYNTSFSLGEISEVADYLPDVFQCLTKSDIDDHLNASNSWGTSQKRSRTGLPILAGDSHREIEVPNVYHQVHLVSPEFNVIGFSFPGVLGIPHFGHNDHVAWSITYGCGDTQDIYLERLNPSSNSYSYDGQWFPIRELAKVRNSTLTPFKHGPQGIAGWTRNGPIIWHDQSQKHGLSLRWTSLLADKTMDGIVSMLSARSCEGIDRCMRSWVEPVNSLISGDRKGQLFFRLRGRIPIRSKSNRWVAVPGWLPEYQWSEYIPFDDMPADRSRNVLITANNPVVGDAYPHYLSADYRSDIRSRRLAELIADHKTIDIDACSEILADTVSLPARHWAESLSQLHSPSEGTSAFDYNSLGNDDLLAALAMTVGWDGNMSIDESAPTLYSEIVAIQVKNMWSELMPDLASKEANLGLRKYSPLLIHQLRRQIVQSLLQDHAKSSRNRNSEVARKADALIQAVHSLRETLGEDRDGWAWGRVHQLPPLLREAVTSKRELQAKFDSPGDHDTLRIAAFDICAPNRDVTECSVTRYIFDTADWDNSLWIIPGGVAEDRGSPHFIDQLPLWQKDILTPAMFSESRIRAQCSLSSRVIPE